MTSSSNGRTVASISYTRIVLVDVRPEKILQSILNILTRRGSLGRLPRHFDLYRFMPGDMMKQVVMTDLKSVALTGVRVRFSVSPLT